MIPQLDGVLIADHGVDAALIDRPTEARTVLVLRPTQTIGSAVAAVSAVFPSAAQDQVRKLVRQHLPHAFDLDELMPAPPPPPLQRVDTNLPRQVKIAGVLVASLIVGGFVAANEPARDRWIDFRNYSESVAKETAAELDVQHAEGLRDLAESVSDNMAEAPRSGKKPTTGPSGRHAAAPVALGAGHQGGSALPSDGAADADAHGSLPAGAAVVDTQGSLPADGAVDACPRSVLDTLAVAYLSEGPTSSTSTSKTVLLDPSLVSKERALSLPCKITLMPRERDSALFSAACRQIEQSKYSVSPSRHSLLCLSKVRGVDATVKLATAAPDGVNLSSGSDVRLPTTVIDVSPDTGDSPFLVEGLLDPLR